jgi:hypothetical protein
VQGHPASLGKPLLEATVFPRAPALLTAHWNTATHSPRSSRLSPANPASRER